MKSFKVEGLFGKFNYKIDFAESGVTLITGPNGFGKSTIIKCIKALAESDARFFWSIRFDMLEIEGTDGATFRIEKSVNSISFNGVNIPNDDMEYAYLGRMYIPSFFTAKKKEAIRHYQSIMRSMAEFIGGVRLIKEQRLQEIRHDDDPDDAILYDVVKDIPRKLKERIQETGAKYSKVANTLESAFVPRLFASKYDDLSEADFKTTTERMQGKAQKLTLYGISDASSSSLDTITFNKDYAGVLKVYFDDLEKKYAQYDGLISQLDMYSGIVNKRFKFKHIKVSATKGLEVFADDGTFIPLDMLSSGEQETLVLFYEVIFNTDDGTILLIDEPEISLHLLWQQMFADDIKRIAEGKRLQVVIATHSAEIASGVSGEYTKDIDLGRLYKDERAGRKQRLN